MDLLDDDQLERSAVVANCRMNRERDLTGTNGYDRELGFNPLDLLKERTRLGSSPRLARPLLRDGQGADPGGQGRPRRGTRLPDRDPGRRSRRHVPPARPRPDLPSARRGVPDFLAARPPVRPDHLRPRPALRRGQARPDRPCRLLARRGRPVRGEPRPGEPQALRRPCGRTKGDCRPASWQVCNTIDESGGLSARVEGSWTCLTDTSVPTTRPGRITPVARRGLVLRATADSVSRMPTQRARRAPGCPASNSGILVVFKLRP